MTNPLDNIVDKIIMQRLAGHCVFLIRRRTQSGQFLPGSSPGADQYSTKPFAMPAYALGKMLGKKLEALASGKRKKQGPNTFTLYTNKKWNNQLWVVAHLGYREIRRMAGRPVDKVSMIFNRGYISGISVLPGESDTKIDIGWKDTSNIDGERPSNNLLAKYHEELGAGKSKRKHKIMGLTQEEITAELLPYAQTEIVQKLMKKGFNEEL